MHAVLVVLVAITPAVAVAASGASKATRSKTVTKDWENKAGMGMSDIRIWPDGTRSVLRQLMGIRGAALPGQLPEFVVTKTPHEVRVESDAGILEAKRTRRGWKVRYLQFDAIKRNLTSSQVQGLFDRLNRELARPLGSRRTLPRATPPASTSEAPR